MSNLAFEITVEDVQIVAERHNAKLSDDMASEFLDLTDQDAIVHCALHFNDLDDQTASVHEDIETALFEEGMIQGKKMCFSPATS